MLRLKLLVVAVIGAIALVTLGVTSAFAGEATGNFGTDHGNNSKTTPIASPGTVAQSICAFSGQNPERFLDPSNPDFEPGRVQNWGHIADRQSLPAFLHPGNSCNGHTGFIATGGEG